MLALTHGHRIKPDIFANPVLHMHHQITACERLQFGEKRIGILALLLAPHQPVAQHILFGQQLQLVIGKTCFERDDHGHGFAAG